MKMPNKAKIYEAFSAIADNRINVYDNYALVKSSDYSKEYTIKWQDNKIASTDNATFWQGYPGYPVIALWLSKGILKYNKELVNNFKNINWHEINNKYKRDYDKAVSEVLENMPNKEDIIKEVDKIFEQILKLDYEIVRKI